MFALLLQRLRNGGDGYNGLVAVREVLHVVLLLGGNAIILSGLAFRVDFVGWRGPSWLVYFLSETKG